MAPGTPPICRITFTRPDACAFEAQIDDAGEHEVFVWKLSVCPSDLDSDGFVGFGDLLLVLSAWGDCLACPEDLDGDGVVGFADLLTVLSEWGSCTADP